MFKVNKNERDYLINHGCEYGIELHKTVCTGKSKWTYVSECSKVFRLLNKMYGIEKPEGKMKY